MNVEYGKKYIQLNQIEYKKRKKRILNMCASIKNIIESWSRQYSIHLHNNKQINYKL